jgi:hypothetical protein
MQSRPYMSTQTSTEGPPHDAAFAAARVIESAMELARAEAKLLVAHAGAELTRSIGAVLAGMVATSAAQVALIVFAFAPVLLASRPLSSVLVALMPSVGLAVVGTCLAVMAWSNFKRAPATAPRSE